MKRNKLLIILLTLIMAALACNLPARQTPDPILEVTAEPSEVNPPQYRSFEAGGIEIQVPNSFVLGVSAADLAAMLGVGSAPGLPGGFDLQSFLENNQEEVLLWGYEADPPGGIPVSFVVLKNDEYAFMPLGIISTFAGSILGDDVDVLEGDRLTIQGRDTLRWIVTASQVGDDLAQVAYVFKGSGTLYIVVFNLGRQAVNEKLPVLDGIVASLRIVE